MNTSGAKRSEYLGRREAGGGRKAAERSGVLGAAKPAEGGEAKCSASKQPPHCSTFAKRSGALGVCGGSGEARNGAKQGGNGVMEAKRSEACAGGELETIFIYIGKM